MYGKPDTAEAERKAGKDPCRKRSNNVVPKRIKAIPCWGSKKAVFTPYLENRQISDLES